MNPFTLLKAINKDADLTHTQARWLSLAVLHADNNSGKVRFAPGSLGKEVGIEKATISRWINDNNNPIHKYATFTKVGPRRTEMLFPEQLAVVPTTTSSCSQDNYDNEGQLFPEQLAVVPRTTLLLLLLLFYLLLLAKRARKGRGVVMIPPCLKMT